MTLEICASSIQSALNAQLAGAQRIELCDNLAQGGTTPSYGTIAQAKNLLDIPVFVLIRPREGDFFYSADEFEVMKKDIEACKELGCDGVVLGILHKDGSVDIKRTHALVKLAKPMQVTFHRAFDRCKDPLTGLEAVIQTGCSRILTSGQRDSAPQGLELIKMLIEKAADRIVIMPGAGINSTNIQRFKLESGASEFHSSAKRKVDSEMEFTNHHLAEDLEEIYESDPQEIKAMLEQLK